MRRVIVVVLVLMVLFSGLATAAKIGEGEIQATVYVMGYAEFIFLAEPIWLFVNPLVNSISAPANWALASNRLGSLRVDFQSVGVDADGIPTWAGELFRYSVTVGTWSSGRFYEGEYIPLEDITAEFHPYGGAQLQAPSTLIQVQEQPFPVEYGMLCGQIQMAFEVPGNERESWVLPTGYSWLDLGTGDDGRPVMYADVIQVTVYEE